MTKQKARRLPVIAKWINKNMPTYSASLKSTQTRIEKLAAYAYQVKVATEIN